MIAKMYFANPSETERFAMRLLLLNTPGATSFSNLHSNNEKYFETYQACALDRGIMHDDKTWEQTMLEAELFTTETELLRELFAMILCYGNPSDPGKLWQSHQGHLTRDILYKERNRLKDHTIGLNNDLVNLSSYHLNQI